MRPQNLFRFLNLFLALTLLIPQLGWTKVKFLSNRPQTMKREMVLIRLSSPSLLADHYARRGAARSGEELAIDKQLQQTIQNEQQSFLNKVSEISKEIQTVYRYSFVMNAVALSAPVEYVEQIKKLREVKEVQKEPLYFHPPKITKAGNFKGRLANLKQNDDEWYTSVDHIKATYAHEELGIRGQGIRVGVIDSGIDYTHAMLGGSGDVNVFQSIDPNKPNEYFPNQKVVGGKDFVGSIYQPGSVVEEQSFPQPDLNPIDDSSGHGTHVAGTIAGIGDGDKTYSGVAPAAELYALKVFGAGSTTDMVVSAAFEYAMDPNQDGDPNDRLDVLNLSLGGSYGKPTGTYEQTLRNVVRAGVVVVAAAGNSGDSPYIVGSPSTTKEAISVAASIDGMEHNWKFPAVSFKTLRDDRPGADQDWITERIEARFTKSIDDMDVVEGKLVYVGLADEDFSQEVKDRLKGHIAFIQRGKVAFVDKVRRAYEAGARGVVVFNNQTGKPIVMGGSSKKEFEIPAIMVSKSLGDEFLKLIELGQKVQVNFKPGEVIDNEDLIDQITDFSSYGPRSGDALLKPEVAAPGQQIISARAGSGDEGTKNNGTSMASPHVAGVMALMVQRYPGTFVKDLKTLLMNSTTAMKDESGDYYDLPAQGSGLVNVKKAMTQKVVASPYAASLGVLNFSNEEALTTKQTLTIRVSKSFKAGLDLADLTYDVEFSENMSFDFSGHPRITYVDGEEVLQMPVKVKLTGLEETNQGMSTHQAVVQVKGSNGEVFARIPFYARGKSNSLVDLKRSEEEKWILRNQSSLSTEVYPFLKMGEDELKPQSDQSQPVESRACDLRQVLARVVKKDLPMDRTQEKVEVLEVGVVLEKPVSFWEACDVSLTFDQDGDGKSDVEALGILGSRLDGLSVANPGLSSVLGTYVLDANKVREIRAQYEEQMRSSFQNNTLPPRLNYLPAIKSIGGWKTFENRRTSILSFPLEALPKSEDGQLKLKVTVSNNRGGIMADDELSKEASVWNLDELRQVGEGYATAVKLQGNQVAEFEGLKLEDLTFLAPKNLEGKELLSL